MFGSSFPRTLRALAGARLGGSTGAIAAATLLIGGWALWFAFGHVSIYAVSQQARLESTQLPVPLQSAVDGVVVQCNVALQQHVRAGEVVVKLDTRALEIERAEADANVSATKSTIEAFQEEVAAQEAARDALAQLVQTTARAGAARVSVSKTNAAFKEKETDVVQELSAKELASKLDALHSQADQETMRAETRAAIAQAARDTSTTHVTLLDREAQIAQLKALLVDAQNRLAVQLVKVQALDYEIERRLVRAPAAGSLVDIAPCTTGMTVDPHARLATLLPDGEVRVVGFFAPQDSVGRVSPGQTAILRVDSYPWTQFGTEEAVVEHVGREPRDGRIRVELRISKPNPAIPNTHGLTSLVEIQVERVTPLALLMRIVGGRIVHPPAPDPSTNGAPAAGSGS